MICLTKRKRRSVMTKLNKKTKRTIYGAFSISSFCALTMVHGTMLYSTLCLVAFLSFTYLGGYFDGTKRQKYYKEDQDNDTLE